MDEYLEGNRKEFTAFLRLLYRQVDAIRQLIEDDAIEEALTRLQDLMDDVRDTIEEYTCGKWRNMI